MRFNMNNEIKVRLTDLGRQILLRQYEAIYDTPYMRERYPYIPPKEDSDGWSTWQMWYFMATFGPYLANGNNLPAHVEIEILQEGK